MSFDELVNGPEPDDGLDSRLSAYLDGELDADAIAEVEQLLSTSDAARAELERAREARDLVRGLPMLELPPETAALFEQQAEVSPLAPQRRRARVRAAMMSAVATAAFWGVVVSSPEFTAAVTPSIDSAVAAHALIPSVGGEMDAMEMDDSMSTDMPAEAGQSMYLVHLEQVGHGVHAVYSDGEQRVSVFSEPGRVDWNALPDGDRVEVSGSPAWHGTVDEFEIVVLERGRRVYIIVAEPTPEVVMDAVGESMPADEPSVMDRVRDAAHDVTTVFGLRG